MDKKSLYMDPGQGVQVQESQPKSHVLLQAYIA